MRGVFSQMLAITGTNFKGLGGRVDLVAATMLCVVLVVATLLGLDALKQGLRMTLEQSGASNIALVMRGGTQSEINSVVTREQLDILRSAPGFGEISPEVNLVVDGYKRTDGQRANISLRGLTGQGIALRPGVRLQYGRWPELGSSELAVGRNVAHTYQNMELGAAVEVGAATWTVVGIFEAEGGVAESEIWADLTAAQNLFNRANTVQSVRLRVAEAEDLDTLANFSKSDPRLQLAVQSESAYYAVQAARTTELAQKLAWPLATLMSIGAVVGALNTMLAVVASRAVEIATLRVIGFRRSAICAGLVIECVLICIIAGLIGAAAAYVVLDGLTASTLAGGITRVGYALKFTLSGLWQGLGLSVAIGVLGAIIPATLAGLRPVTIYLAR